MGQALKDIPKTPEEERRQKGPVPLNAVFLVIGLFLVFLLYYSPAIWSFILGNN